MYIMPLITLHISWHFTSHGTSHLVVIHVLCYFTSCDNQDFHGKYFNITWKYLRVTMRGLSCLSEVTAELYRI